MGYAHYEVIRNGERIEAGYAVEAMCDRPDCTAKVWRGLDALCGQTPGGDEFGCGGYFCDADLYLAPEGQNGYRCFLCRDRATDPLADSPDAMTVIFDHA
ncbi:hypothetical protein [Streptomyces sp. NPDC097640]|uniref:hypothetical protein n=1 Tax=Streptomyces sp. NPDC097640 TaxID=3157229 RepID=UPI003316885B